MGFIVFVFLIILIGCATTSSPDTEQAKLDAWNTVQAINRHWAITEDMDSLALYIHDDMTLISPGSILVGKDAIIDSYRKYAEYAETVGVEDSESLVQLYNDNQTAVVTYKNHLTIKKPDGGMESFISRDMYSLVFDKGRWLAVAQHYSFIEAE